MATDLSNLAFESFLLGVRVSETIHDLPPGSWSPEKMFRLLYAVSDGAETLQPRGAEILCSATNPSYAEVIRRLNEGVDMEIARMVLSRLDPWAPQTPRSASDFE